MSKEKTNGSNIENVTASEENTLFDESTVKRVKKRKSLPIKILCYTAVFTALSAIANIYTLFVGAGGAFALSLTYIPDFFAGALLGPLPGLITGLAGDLLGCWIAPKGDLNPIILVASGLMGLIPGIVFRLFDKCRIKKSYFIAGVISVILVYGVCTTLNTIGLYLFYFKGIGRTLEAVFILRTPKQTIIWAVNAAIIMLMLYPMKKIINI